MTIQPQNNNVNYLIDPTFTNVNRLFVLPFPGNNNTDSKYSYSNYYAPKVNISDFNVLIEFSLNWIENCILTVNPNVNNNINKATFTITDAKRYLPIVTLKTEDNVKLSKLLSKGIKRPIYWNKYKVIPNEIINITINDREYHLRELLDSSWQGVKILFVLAYNNSVGDDGQVSVDSFKKYFLPKVKIENCNIEIDGKNFYDQPINDLIKQHDEIRKIATG